MYISVKQYLVNDKKKGSIIMQKHKTIMQTFAVTLSAVMLFGTAANAETIKLTGKGFTDIKGTDAEKNSTVTIEIVSDKINISDDSVWSGFTDNGENTAFMGTVRADENGVYEFNIFLAESGKYVVRMGNSGFKAVKEDSLWFTNEDSLKQRLGEIKTAAQADDTVKIKEILENNRYDIKIFSSIGDDADYEKAASILGEYIKINQLALTEDRIGILAEKACVLSVLSDNTFKGFGEYSDGFGAEDLKVYEFYKDSFADEFTKMMKADNPKSIDEYNSAVEKNMILCLIKYGDSSGELKDCLTLYADEIGVDGSKITADMCKALMNEKDINGYSDIKIFVQNYGKNGGSQNSGGSGKGSSGGGYGGKASDNTPNMGSKTYSDELMPDKYEEGASVFGDMKGYEWATPAVEGLFASGIINGKEPGRFAPEDSVLREEFVKMIVKAFKLSVVGEKVPFLDIDENGWYREYIECAYNSGIISGYSDTEFGIGDSVSREDLVVMILRGIDICDYKLNNKSENIKLSDAEEISDYAKEAVEKLSAAGIINGDESGKFNPKQSATRAETAKILWMTIQNCEQ